MKLAPFLRAHLDDVALVAGVGISYGLLAFVTIFGYYALWASLAIIVFVALYFSLTFFQEKYMTRKLGYFLLLIILIIGYFSIVYRSFGIIDSSNGELVVGEWLNAIYFSVVTWTTLGFGDFRPTDDVKVWVMAEALMGYIFMALLVAKILFLVNRHNNPSQIVR